MGVFVVALSRKTWASSSASLSLSPSRTTALIPTSRAPLWPIPLWDAPATKLLTLRTGTKSQSTRLPMPASLPPMNPMTLRRTTSFLPFALEVTEPTPPVLSSSLVSRLTPLGSPLPTFAFCPQANQVDDEMDYNCGVINGTGVAGTSGNVTLQVTSSVDNATTVEIYAGFANGDACTASAVSSGGSWWWIVIVLIVIVVIIVIVAAVGGFLYMKKKKSSYQLYEDA